ncbi:MAG: phage head spike fiber domain-containing protein, partial [Saprospiraceae bacterium]
MSEVLWPPDLVPSSQTWRIVGNTGVFESPLSGAVRTVSRPGGRLACRIAVPPVKGQNRARLMAVLGALRDRSNTLWMPDFSTTARGSFSAPELLGNNDFSNGTTGWNPGGVTTITGSVSDRVYRMTRTGYGYGQVSTSSSAVAAYTPLAGRAFISAHSRSTPFFGGVYFVDAASVSTFDYAAAGLRTASLVANAAGSIAFLPTDYPEGTGTFDRAGSWAEFSYTSLARCALADAGPNALLYSDQFDNAAWSKQNCTVTANNATAPDGTATGDSVVETTSTGGHGLIQAIAVSSGAQDMTFAVDVLAGTRTWALVQITDGSTHANGVYVNLSTGALGSASVSGSNITNGRYTVSDRGNGWKRITVTARKTGTQTTIYGLVYAATADNGASYSG